MSDAQEKLEAETANFQFQVGLGGIDYQLSIVPTSGDAESGGRDIDPRGARGDYKVIVTLGRPGFSVTAEHR